MHNIRSSCDSSSSCGSNSPFRTMSPASPASFAIRYDWSSIEQSDQEVPFGIKESPDLGSFFNSCNDFSDTEFPEVSDEEYASSSGESEHFLIFDGLHGEEDTSSEEMSSDFLSMEDTEVEDLTVIEKENVNLKDVVLGKQVIIRCKSFYVKGSFSMDESSSIKCDDMTLSDSSFCGDKQLFAKTIFINNSYITGNVTIFSLKELVIRNSFLGQGVVLRCESLIIEESFTTEGGYIDAKNITIRKGGKEVRVDGKDFIKIDQDYVVAALCSVDESSGDEEKDLCVESGNFIGSSIMNTKLDECSLEINDVNEVFISLNKEFLNNVVSFKYVTVRESSMPALPDSEYFKKSFENDRYYKFLMVLYKEIIYCLDNIILDDRLRNVLKKLSSLKNEVKDCGAMSYFLERSIIVCFNTILLRAQNVVEDRSLWYILVRDIVADFYEMIGVSSNRLLHMAIIWDTLYADSPCATISESIVKRSEHRIVERDSNDNTPFHYAVLLGNVEIIRMLLSNHPYPGGLIDEINNDIETSFHLAIKNRSDEVIRLLIEYGASVNARNDKGEKPMDMAKILGRLSTIEILKPLERFEWYDKCINQEERFQRIKERYRKTI